jgi:hypothetical protein
MFFLGFARDGQIKERSAQNKITKLSERSLGICKTVTAQNVPNGTNFSDQSHCTPHIIITNKNLTVQQLRRHNLVHMHGGTLILITMGNEEQSSLMVG